MRWTSLLRNSSCCTTTMCIRNTTIRHIVTRCMPIQVSVTEIYETYIKCIFSQIHAHIFIILYTLWNDYLFYYYVDIVEMSWLYQDYENQRIHSLNEIKIARSDDEHLVVRGPSRQTSLLPIARLAAYGFTLFLIFSFLEIKYLLVL